MEKVKNTPLLDIVEQLSFPKNKAGYYKARLIKQLVEGTCSPEDCLFALNEPLPLGFRREWGAYKILHCLGVLLKGELLDIKNTASDDRQYDVACYVSTGDKESLTVVFCYTTHEFYLTTVNDFVDAEYWS